MQVQAPGGLHLEGRFNGWFFALAVWGAHIWGGLYMDGLIFEILRIRYCSIMWGSCGENRAPRPITFSSCDRRSVEILDEIGWDNFETRRTRQLATIMYTLKRHIVPDHSAQVFNSTNWLCIPKL